jgi:hypothetical protein
MENVNPYILQSVLIILVALAMAYIAIEGHRLRKKKAEEPNPPLHEKFADAKTCSQQHRDIDRRLTALEKHSILQDEKLALQYKELRKEISNSSSATHKRMDAIASAVSNLTGSLETFMKLGGKS